MDADGTVGRLGQILGLLPLRIPLSQPRQGQHRAPLKALMPWSMSDLPVITATPPNPPTSPEDHYANIE